MKDRFGFPEGTIEMLRNLDDIPFTEPGSFPGIPGKLFIISRKQKIEIENIVEVLEKVTSHELGNMTEEEKWFYSSLLNNADVVRKNSICSPERIKNLEKER